MSNPSRKDSKEKRGRPSGASREKAPAARRKKRFLVGVSTAVVAALVGVVLGLHFSRSSSGAASAASQSRRFIPVGRTAPNGTFTTLAGTTDHVASLRGQPTLIWFVTTWCSSCQYGTHVMAEDIAKLQAKGVRVEEVELYQDMGQKGTPIGPFAKSLAGAQYKNPDWSFGVSSATLTRTYDPKSYLDIYYLLNAKGKITYVNSSPGSTLTQLLHAASKLA